MGGRVKFRSKIDVFIVLFLNVVIKDYSAMLLPIR